MPVPTRPCRPCDPDPFGLVDAFLGMAAPCSADAERVFLAWLVSLAETLDPARAAASLLAARERSGVAPPTDPTHRRLLALLGATERWPRSAVAALAVARPSPLELS